MENKTVLIVEDNRDLSTMMKSYLKNDGYFVLQAFDGATAVDMARDKQPDIVLLDLMLPLLNGEDVCRTIRKDLNIPIIVTSAKSAENDKLLLLQLGADDYLTKPFSLKEMVARVNAQIRRATTFNVPKQRNRRYGELTIAVDSCTVTVSGQPLILSAREYKLLDFLTLNEEQVFSKQQLIDRVWGVDEIIDENTVAVTVARLRDKLLKVNVTNVVTVWGVGYKWQK